MSTSLQTQNYMVPDYVVVKYTDPPNILNTPSNVKVLFAYFLKRISISQ